MADKIDIFTNYFRYTEDTEPPIVYHRWCWLATLGAFIGRKSFLYHGHSRVFPNLYVQLIGEPSARKSTSIKMVKRLASAAGYSNFSFDKTTKEKFLSDLEGLSEDIEPDTYKKNGGSKTKYDLTTATNLWGDTAEDDPREVFIVADEFNEFAGPGNTDFYTTLGNLWDFDDPHQPFTQRFKNTKSISIYQPTISLLSGNTPVLFARAFPPDTIGIGFLARLLLIYGERSSRRITFPAPPDIELGNSLVMYLKKLLEWGAGALEKTKGAVDLLNKIYQEEEPTEDVRFRGYQNRRFTQLQKLCVILATAKFQKEVTEEDALQANTILSYAELHMPKALGEFGKSKNSDVANKIVDIVDAAIKPITILEIWSQMRRDLTVQKDLVDIVNGLIAADKLQIVSFAGGSGFLPKKKIQTPPKYIDWSFLTQEERDLL